MPISDDIEWARKSGKTDDQILDALSSYSPEFADGIKFGRENKRSSADIITALSSYAPASKGDEEGQDSRPLWRQVTDPFRYGAAQAAQGYADTARLALGNEGYAKTAAETAQSAASFVRPDNYEPAHVTLNPTTWGDVPKAVAEGVPALAVDMPAASGGAAVGSAVGAFGGPFAFATIPAGAIIGGLIGGTGSYLARNYGSDARTASKTRMAEERAAGRSVTEGITDADKNSALLAGGLSGAINTIGLKGLGRVLPGVTGTAVKEVAGPAAQQLVKQAGIAGVQNAASNVAQEAVNQGILEHAIDTERLGGAAVTGAATGASVRGAAGVRDINAAKKFADIPADVAEPLANRILAVHGDSYRGSARQDYEAVRKVGSDLSVRAADLAQDANVKGHLADIKQRNQHDTTSETLGRVQADINEGRQASTTDIDALNASLGKYPHGAALVDTIRQQSALNKIKSLGHFAKDAPYFAGGLSGSPLAQAVLNPVSPSGAKYGAGGAVVGSIGSTLPGMSFMHGLGNIAKFTTPIQAGIYGTLRGVDSLTGNRSPTRMFTDRFGDPSKGPSDTTQRGPSFLDEQQARVLAERLSAQQKRAEQAQANTPAAPSIDPVAAAKAEQVLTRRMPRRWQPGEKPPETVALETRDGTRHQVMDNIRTNKKAVHNGIDTRSNARRDIFSAIPNIEGLSADGLSKLTKGTDDILRRSFNQSKPAGARGIIENFLDDLSPADAQLVRSHLKTFVDPSTGMTFYGSWD